MNQPLAVKILTAIREIQSKHEQLAKLGIDLEEYETRTISLLEECVAVLASHDEQTFESALNDIQWWLYETDKTVFVGDNELDLTDISAFVIWLFRSL